MKAFQSLLVLIDPQLKNARALDQAAALAAQGGGRVTLVTVLPEPSGLQRLLAEEEGGAEALIGQAVAAREALLRGYAEELSARGLWAESLVLRGVASIEVIRAVLRRGHDLVIATAEGRGGLRARLFGSLTTHLMRKCPCPVWVVKSKGRKRLARVLAAVDVGEDASETQSWSLNARILELALALARRDGGELHLVQAWSVLNEGYLEVRGNLDPSAMRRVRKRARQVYASRLGALVQGQPAAGVPIRVHLAHGEPTGVIARIVERLKPDVLVMGTVSRTGMAGLLIGNTAERVLDEVQCSVLTLKPEGFQTPVTLPEAESAG